MIARAPFNLIRYGDPGSLPVPLRIRTFGPALTALETVDREKLWFVDDSLRRFADPALDPHFDEWWKKSAGKEEAQHLILRLIWHGRQRGGLEVARTVAFDADADEITQLLGVRALLALGEPADRDRLANYISDHGGTLPRSLVLESIGGLFPAHMSVAEFFGLIDQIGVTDSGGHASILPLNGEIVDAFDAPDRLGAFIDGLLARSGDFSDEREHHPFRDAFSRIAALAAIKLLDWHPDDIPDAVTDLTLLLHENSRISGVDGEFRALAAAFEASPGRRRTSFWRAVERLRTHPYVTEDSQLGIWFVNHLGWPVAVGKDDLLWLIEDIRHRPTPRERMQALHAAHQLWRQFGENETVLEHINRAAADDEALADQLARWRNPEPDPPEHVQQMARLEEARKRNEAQTEERDKSWLNLIAELRADPSVFDHLSPQTPESVDSRLFHLWQFLSWRTHSRTRYSIDNLDAVAPILGPDLTRRFGDALMAFADARLRVALTEDALAQRRVSNFDIMALGGLSLAASMIPNWAGTLNSEQAVQAAQLAMIELNGFPDYLMTLAAAYREAVRAELVRGAMGQLAAADPAAHGMLDRLEYADGSLGGLVVSDLVSYLDDHPDISVGMLEKIASVLLKAMPFKADGLHDLILRRTAEIDDPVSAAYYLLLLFALEGDAAVDAFRDKMAALDPQAQSALCITLLPRLVGGRFNRAVAAPTSLSVASLERLLLLAFEGIRPSDDVRRPSGVVYSPDDRDDAQGARDMIFDRLIKTPGEATHAALKRLELIKDFPIPAEMMRIYATRRAEDDAALPPWAPEDVVTFERAFDRPPTTTGDLQLIARRRLEALQHDLINGKFAQGDTLQRLPDEPAVQRWIATQLEARQQEAYTVQREVHYADEKEPDVTLVSRHSGVELPIEIKVIDGLSVEDLETALVTQLCGQYLRHSAIRYGILLLVYQKTRKKGWKLKADGPFVQFDQVLDHLRRIATTIRERSAIGPQPVVEILDVSAVVTLGDKKRATRAKRGATKGK